MPIVLTTDQALAEGSLDPGVQGQLEQLSEIPSQKKEEKDWKEKRKKFHTLLRNGSHKS